MVLSDFYLEEKHHNTGNNTSSPYINIGFRNYISFLWPRTNMTTTAAIQKTKMNCMSVKNNILINVVVQSV